MSDSYVGISGFVTRDEVASALAAFPDCGRKLMVGVLASKKTLCEEPVRQFRRHPIACEIAQIFVDDPRCLNLAHYASDDPPEPLMLGRLAGTVGRNCHGVQFNVSWPSPAHVALLLEYVPHWRVVLQVRGFLSSDAVLVALRPYVGIATEVLLDSSGGRGEPMDVDLMRRWVNDLRAADLGFSIGVAGGLYAATIPSIGDLLREGVSVDAEGKLRDDADGGGRLDMLEAHAYLAAIEKELSA